MFIPISCFSCSKPVGHLWGEYKEKTSKGEHPKKVIDDLEGNQWLNLIYRDKGL